MDFIDEENVPLAEIRQSSNEVAGFFEGGAGGAADIHTQFACDELSECGLAEAWRSKEQSVVQRLSASEGCIYIDAQGFLNPVLADEFGQTLGAERKLDYALVGDDFGGGYFGARHWRLMSDTVGAISMKVANNENNREMPDSIRREILRGR